MPERFGERPVFRRRHRMSGAGEFEAVFGARLRKSRGPITVFLLPTGNSEHRLGLSIGRRLGPAVVRGRFKRRIRDVFRCERAALPRPGGAGDPAPGAYDIVVTARRHDPMTIEGYRVCFVGAFLAAHRAHQKRTGR